MSKSKEVPNSVSDASLHDVVMSSSFEGISPGGKPETFRMAEGRWAVPQCPDCGETNGMFCVNEKHPIEQQISDEYGPMQVPCIWCAKGPMVPVFIDQE